MGLVGHRRRVLRPFLFLTQIRSGPTVDTILDLSHADSHGRVADCKCELEWNFFSQEGSLVELCIFCALSSVSVRPCGSSASYSQPAVRLVCPLPCLSRICNLVGLPCVAPQSWFVPKQLMIKIHPLRAAIRADHGNCVRQQNESPLHSSTPKKAKKKRTLVQSPDNVN